MNRRNFLSSLIAAPAVVAVIPYVGGVKTEIVDSGASQAVSGDVTTDYWGNETDWHDEPIKDWYLNTTI